MWEHFEVDLDYLVRRATFCGWEILPRCISNYEVVYVLKGQGKVMIEEKQFMIHAGDLVCFRPGVRHSLSVTQEPCMEFYGVHFTLPDGMEQLPLPDLAQIESGIQLEALFKNLLDVYQKKAYLYQWKQNLLLQQILCEIFSILHQENMPVEHARIKKVLEYIHEDPFRPIVLADLTACAGVKKTLFLQSFRKVTGTSPKQYIIELRLEYARELLLETQLPVSRIAEQCGFPDAFYFSRRFKARFSLSPQQYRKVSL